MCCYTDWAKGLVAMMAQILHHLLPTFLWGDYAEARKISGYQQNSAEKDRT